MVLILRLFNFNFFGRNDQKGCYLGQAGEERYWSAATSGFDGSGETLHFTGYRREVPSQECIDKGGGGISKKPGKK
jgi:hypothetical protein